MVSQIFCQIVSRHFARAPFFFAAFFVGHGERGRGHDYARASYARQPPPGTTRANSFTSRRLLLRRVRRSLRGTYGKG
jgi:hypothetical protein